METAIKPIETIYNGYRFRSRLEARWAVFFDAAGIKFEYEIEGFDLGNGVYYLPDFYLPEFEIFVEIKPGYSSLQKDLRDKAEAKCSAFRDIIGQAIYMFSGNPWDNHWGRLYAFDYTDDSAGSSEFQARFVSLPWCHEQSDPILLCSDRSSSRTICINSDFDFNKKVLCGATLGQQYPTACGDWVTTELMYEMFEPNDRHMNEFNKAKLKAQQARFEHGERP